MGPGVIPEGFLPFGPAYDSPVPTQDDGSSMEIQLVTDVVIFGSRQNRLYVSICLLRADYYLSYIRVSFILLLFLLQVNTNGVISFGTSFTSTSSNGVNFDRTDTPPIIAPFWDDINTINGGTIYYRVDTDPIIRDLVNQEILAQYPAEFPPFQATLVFVATWDRVQPFYSNLTGQVNTFQAVIASDGTRSFVRFTYGDIQWGRVSTLIGVSAGDRVNYITHPLSLSSSVTSIANTNVTYRIDRKWQY